jgi:UrcA family protein
MIESERHRNHLSRVGLFAVLMVSPVEWVQAGAQYDEAPSVTLHFHSTDLNTPQGISGLYRRISVAASMVCDRYDGASLEEKSRWHKCFDKALAEAVAHVNSESLSAYHWHQTRGCRRPSIESPTSLATREPFI